jgi:hypothetical protein
MRYTNLSMGSDPFDVLILGGNLEKAKVKLKKKGGKLKKEEILIPSELPARSESSQFRRDFLVPPNRRLEIASGLCMIEKVLMLSLVFGEVEN